MSTNQSTAAVFSIDPATTVGLVSLTVSNLARSLTYYTEAIGLALLQQEGSTAVLGAGAVPLLLLNEEPGAQPWPRGGRSYTGLYHFAILVPTRADLGRWVRHWLTLGLPLGQGDHLVSEALYLEDPDGHGIEVYRDRPRSEWRWHNGRVQMATDPVDIRGLIEEANRAGVPWTGLPAGTRLGHVHLQVGDIAQSTRFYHAVLGFDVVAQMPSALFISAGGYHHHIGMNIWHSQGAAPAPAESVRLRFFTIDFASEAARSSVLERLDAAGLPYQRRNGSVTVQDPWLNTLVLQVGAAADVQATQQFLAVDREASPVFAAAIL